MPGKRSLVKTLQLGIRIGADKMKQFKWQLTLIVASVIIFLIWPYFNNVQLPGEGFSTFGSDTVRAEVTQIGA